MHAIAMEGDFIRNAPMNCRPRAMFACMRPIDDGTREPYIPIHANRQRDPRRHCAHLCETDDEHPRSPYPSLADARILAFRSRTGCSGRRWDFRLAGAGGRRQFGLVPQRRSWCRGRCVRMDTLEWGDRDDVLRSPEGFTPRVELDGLAFELFTGRRRVDDIGGRTLAGCARSDCGHSQRLGEVGAKQVDGSRASFTGWGADFPRVHLVTAPAIPRATSRPARRWCK